MSWLKKAVKKVKNGFKKSHQSRNIRRYGLGPVSMLVEDVVKHSGLKHKKVGDLWRHPNRVLKRSLGNLSRRSDNNARSCSGSSCGQAARNAGWSTVGSTGFHRFVGGTAQ